MYRQRRRDRFDSVMPLGSSSRSSNMTVCVIRTVLLDNRSQLLQHFGPLFRNFVDHDVATADQPGQLPSQRKEKLLLDQVLVGAHHRQQAWFRAVDPKYGFPLGFPKVFPHKIVLLFTFQEASNRRIAFTGIVQWTCGTVLPQLQNGHHQHYDTGCVLSLKRTATKLNPRTLFSLFTSNINKREATGKNTSQHARLLKKSFLQLNFKYSVTT